ncbi:ankyrin repeat domain-containing protein 17-like [Physella acuta]|uniref:ankyrin repeat domain-containing protein 17-like n=1 Tax=Physella acuta TaxID=109671 RepID=UPI0027DE9EF8|nr:ankyrin repeat domain-containing protein 17-like [Physella acuta]
MERSSQNVSLLDMISVGSPDVLSYLHLVRSGQIVVCQPTLDQCLLVACDKGSRLYVTYLLQAGADIETRDCHGNTPLLVATTNGIVDIAELLIEHGADVNASDIKGNTSLILSMRSGCSVEVAEALLNEEGINMEHCNEKGETALTKALKEVELEKVKMLLLGGACLSDAKEIKESGENICSECAQEIADKTGIGEIVRLIQKYKSDESILLEAVLKRDLTSVKLLVETELVKIKHVNEEDPLIIFKLLSSINERKSKVTGDDIELTAFLVSHGFFLDEKGSEVTLAADIGDVHLIEVFCQHGVLVPYQAMVVSAAKGRTDIISILIKYTVSVNHFDNNNLPIFAGSALESALSKGELECAEILLQNNAKMEVSSALSTVITHRQKECLRMISERFTSACQAAVCSSTSELLLTAASTSDVGVIEVLLELDADVNQLVCGNTALTKSFNLGMVNFLIHRGADVNIDLNDTKSPTVLLKILSAEYFEDLMKALNTNDKVDCYILRDEITQEILKHFTRVNVENETGDTALTVAAKMDGTKKIIEMLLKAGCCLEHKNKEGETAFYIAALSDNMSNVKLLIDKGADIDVKVDHSTALVRLADECKSEMCEYLITRGANVNTCDRIGRTALGNAAENEDSFLVDQLIEKGADIFHHDHSGFTVLMFAASSGDFDVVKILLKAGADKRIDDSDKYGETALFHAIQNDGDYVWKNTRVINSLIYAGACVNHRNKKGMTPLMVAVKWENQRAILCSKLSEADVSLMSYHNPPKTALSIALSNLPGRPKRMCKIVKHLLDRGAKADLVSPEFVHLFIALGKDSIAQQLIKAGVGPSEVEITKNFNYWFTSSYRLTPLCVALLMKNVVLAEYFIKICFLTNSDLQLLSQSEKVIKYLEQKLRTDCAEIFKPYAKTPLRLEMMAFVAVSSAIGSHPNRPARVEKTGLPYPLMERLLFLADDTLLKNRNIENQRLFREICSCNPKLNKKLKSHIFGYNLSSPSSDSDTSDSNDSSDSF